MAHNYELIKIKTLGTADNAAPFIF